MTEIRNFIEIRSKVLEPEGVEIRRFPLFWLLATSCELTGLD